MIELVRREHKEVQAEMHQTDSRQYRAKISQRLGLLDGLLKVLCPNENA